MSVRARRRTEQGQALILALVLLGLLSAFSVSLLRLSSSSGVTSSSVRQSAYRDAEREAGALTARQMVAQGLGCSATPITTTFGAGETITVRVAQKPGNCLTPGPGDSGDLVSGTYVLCSTVSASGGPYPAIITVNVNSQTVDIVRFTYGNPPGSNC